MDIFRDNLSDLAELEFVPSDKQLPPHELPPNALMGALLNPAFECESEAEAGVYIRKLLIHWLRFGKSKDPKKAMYKLTVKEAIAQIRTALWWFALARDIGENELYSTRWVGDTCEKVERTKYRELACQLFGASDLSRKAQDAELLDRVHSKRERAAKKRGEVYWRKVHAPQAAEQGVLF